MLKVVSQSAHDGEAGKREGNCNNWQRSCWCWSMHRWLAVCAAVTVAVVGYASGGSGSMGCKNSRCQCTGSVGNLHCSTWWSRDVVMGSLHLHCPRRPHLAYDLHFTA